MSKQIIEPEVEKIYAILEKNRYSQKSIKKRIEAFLLDNVGRIATSEQIIEVSIDPITGKVPENWHQRLSELRTDDGYTILSWRNRGWLRVEEYLLASTEKRLKHNKRVKPTKETWEKVLLRAHNSCEWSEGSSICGLTEEDIDPIGGGKIKLTADHMNPHSINIDTDPSDSEQWQALCGRHQIMKKNYWNTSTGKMNVYAIINTPLKS